MPNATNFIETASLGNALVNYNIQYRNKTELLGGLGSIMRTAKPMNLPNNADTDTLGIEYNNAFSDNDTAGNTPGALVSRRTGTDLTLTDTPLIGVNGLAQLPMAMYGRHTFITKSTKKILKDNVIDTYGKKMVCAAIADVGKLAFRTFDALGTTDATSGVADGEYTRCANAVANEGAVIAEIAPADVKDMVNGTFNTYNISPLTEMVSVENNFSVMSIRPSYILYVHPHVATDVVENFTGTLEFVHISQYAGRGFKALDPLYEVGIIPKYDVRVIKSPFVKAQTGVATNATANMRQSGGVNITYHNILLGANAWSLPSVGKMVEVDVALQSGEQERIKKASGIDFMVTEPVGGKSDPYKQIWTLGYTFWLGDKAVEAGARASNAGGILIPNANSSGTVIYSAAKIITTASA